MVLVARGFLRLLALAAVTAAAPACAQDNLQRGKSPQQLFASDCAICHKSPQGLAKSGGLFGLQGFLREHYTTSRETAAMLARYLEAAGSPPAAAERKTPPPRRTSKPTADTKPSETKPAEARPAESKPPETKPTESKPSDPKPEEAKIEAKPEPKPEPKPEVKPETTPAKESSGAEIKSGIAVTPAPADQPAKTE